MDVRDLAPALLSLGDLFREASVIVAPDAPPVALEIRATDRGSFEVQLILSQVEWLRLFSSSEVGGLANLMGLVLGSGTIALGLFKLIQLLRKRKVKEQRRIEPGIVRLILDDGTTLEVPEDLLKLYGSVSIRRRTRQVLAPLDREGILQVRMQSSDMTLELGKDDAAAFELPELPSTPLGEQVMERHLTIASVVFVEGNKWRLTDGEATFYARIEDESFLARVESGEEAFRSGDIMRCELRITQTRSSDGKLQAEYAVAQVRDHLALPRTLPLPFDV